MAEPVLSWWGGWVPAFALTCVIEVGVYLLMFAVFGLAGATPTGAAGTGAAGRGSGRPSPGRVSPGRARSGSLSWGRATWLALGVNVVSHPVFWAVALRFDSTAQLVVGELVVVLVEGLLIFAVVRRSWPACLASALVANAASAVLGATLLALITSSWVS